MKILITSKLFLLFIFLLFSLINVQGQKNPHFKTSFQLSTGLMYYKEKASIISPSHTSLGDEYFSNNVDLQLSALYSIYYFSVGTGIGLSTDYTKNNQLSNYGKFFIVSEIGNGVRTFPVSLIIKAGLKEGITPTYTPYYSIGPSVNFFIIKHLLHLSVIGFMEYQNTQKKDFVYVSGAGTPWPKTFYYTMYYTTVYFNFGVVVSLYPETLIKKKK